MARNRFSKCNSNMLAYQSWSMMRNRCLNPNRKDWFWYGGRGIKICERWINSFENFLADMGEREIWQSLDRIDSNGNYEPENCRWIHKLDQPKNLNPRRTVFDIQIARLTQACQEVISGQN